MTTTSRVTQSQEPPLTGFRDYSGNPVAVLSVTVTFSADREPTVDMGAVAIKKDGTAGVAPRHVRYDERQWVRLPVPVRDAFVRAARHEAAILARSLGGAS